ncbi:MAG: imidazole glycerol phosphate synthase subunit HisF [Myxococcales bacterium]|nr:imidazole glycerol phosphate synthase subunit HisF [Myxococcales bacterium]
MSSRPRVIPCLLLDGASLVKTVRFQGGVYIGDPANTVRIFNELEVDELCVLDTSATRQGRPPNLELLRELATEAFMPLSYGGGLRSLDTCAELLRMGFEKVVLNSAAVERPALIGEAARQFGNQAVVISIDVRRKLLGRYEVMTVSGTRRGQLEPSEWAARAADAGAGEILLTAIDREGTWSGYDLELVRQVSRRVSVPVIANGGAGSVGHLAAAIRAGASAVAVGSMVVFQGEGLGVLVNFPDQHELRSALRT